MPEQFPPPGYYLRIKDWNEHFELAQSRKIKGALDWVPIPTSRSGIKFNRLMSKQNGHAVFGVFILLVEVAARNTPRGDLWSLTGSPLATRDLVRVTGMRARSLERCLKVLMSNEIGWIEMVACSQRAPSLLPTEQSRLEEIREEEKRERARAREAPLRPAHHTHGNSSLASQNGGRPKELRDHPALNVYWDRLHPARVPSSGVQDKIIEVVAEDLPGWTKQLDYWVLNGHRAESVGNLLDRYREQRDRTAATDDPDGMEKRLFARLKENGYD